MSLIILIFNFAFLNIYNTLENSELHDGLHIKIYLTAK